MNDQPSVKGPWFLRFLILVFSVLLGLLIFWLLGFVLNDIGDWPGPDYNQLAEQMIDPALHEQQERLSREIADLEREVSKLRTRQGLLQESTSSSQQTMNQLLEFARLSLERDMALSAEEQEALAESQQRFLANQRQYQELNQQIVERSEALRAHQDQLRQVESRLEEARKPVQAEYERAMTRHNVKIAAVKLAVLLPVLAVAVAIFMRYRGTVYAPLAYALGIAVLLKIGQVLHEYFPARYFKYVLVLVSLAVVLRVLLYLLRSLASPSRQTLLRQFREAYEVFLCPICSFPIRRGPLTFQYWTARTLKKKNLPSSDGATADEPYTCPSCSTRLYEECESCHKIRPSLLPSCPHCGTTRDVA